MCMCLQSAGVENLVQGASRENGVRNACVVCAPTPKITVCLFSQTYQCILMRKHLSITLFATITSPSLYQKHNISFHVFSFSVSKCAHTYRSVHISSACVVYVCVRIYIIFTTAIAYGSRIWSVSRVDFVVLFYMFLCDKFSLHRDQSTIAVRLRSTPKSHSTCNEE